MGTIKLVKLLAIREGLYTVYVFKNLENDEYIMCTRLPNWQVPNIEIEDEGFLEYVTVKAGEEYFDPSTETFIKYKYSNIYFINFILKTNVLKNNEIIL